MMYNSFFTLLYKNITYVFVVNNITIKHNIIYYIVFFKYLAGDLAQIEFCASYLCYYYLCFIKPIIHGAVATAAPSSRLGVVEVVLVGYDFTMCIQLNHKHKFKYQSS